MAHTDQQGSQTIVWVGRHPAADLADALSNRLSGLGLPVDGLRVLSTIGDVKAVEAVIPAGVPIAPKTLTHAIPDEVDAALVPTTNRRKRLLICDMDSTIITEECLDELADFAGLKAEISAITERAMAGELDFEAALTTRVGLLKGLDLGALERCYEERIRLTPGAATLVRTMSSHGARCVLVSGGFTFFTERVAKAAGFHAHRGNTLLDDGAALTGEVGRPILGREAKQTALEEEAAALDLTPEDALAMGDGANDLAMIERAGLGIAFDAKPVVAAAADAAIRHTDLRAALFYQGYRLEDFVN